jgi:hypothetical protein
MMKTIRYALQWLGLLVSIPFSAWGAVQLIWHEDRASLTRNNLGLDRPGLMREAWGKVRARPWSGHAWKDVTAEFCGQVHSQVPAKVFALIVIVVFVAGLLAGCAGGGEVAGVSGPGSGEAPHGAVMAAVEVLRLF